MALTVIGGGDPVDAIFRAQLRAARVALWSAFEEIGIPAEAAARHGAGPFSELLAKKVRGLGILPDPAIHEMEETARADSEMLRSCVHPWGNSKGIFPLSTACILLETAAKEWDSDKPSEAFSAIASALEAIGMGRGLFYSGNPEKLMRWGQVAANRAAAAVAASKARAAGEATRDRIRQAALRQPAGRSKEVAAAAIAAEVSLSGSTVRDYLKRLFPGDTWRNRSATTDAPE